MKKKLWPTFVLVALTAISAGGQESGAKKISPSGKAGTIEDAERAFTVARDTKDEDALRRILHSDFIWVDRYGKVATQKEWLMLPIPPADVSDQEVRIHGDTGVRSAVIKVTQNGTESRIRIVRVWTNENGTWKLVHHQSTLVTQK